MNHEDELKNQNGNSGWKSRLLSRRFSRKLVGGLDEEEVRSVLAEVTTHVERVPGALAQARTQREQLERAVQEAAARADDLVGKLAVAEHALADAETQLTEARQDAAASRQRLAALEEHTQKIIEQTLQAARAPEQVLAAAQIGAERIVAEARDQAAATREKAAEFEEQARKTIEQTLRSARAQAEQVTATAQTNAERIVADAKASAARFRAEADGYVADISRRVGALLALHEEFSRGLDIAQTRHEELLGALAQLRSDTRERVLPLLERSQRVVHGTAAPEEAGTGAAREEPPVTESVRPAPQPEAWTPEPVREGEQAGLELVVGPFASLFDVTKFLTVLSRLANVKKARIRTFSERTATFDVALVSGGLDTSQIPGYRLDVLERAGNRLVLRRSSVQP